MNRPILSRLTWCHGGIGCEVAPSHQGGRQGEEGGSHVEGWGWDGEDRPHQISIRNHKEGEDIIHRVGEMSIKQELFLSEPSLGSLFPWGSFGGQLVRHQQGCRRWKIATSRRRWRRWSRECWRPRCLAVLLWKSKPL